MGLCSPGLAPGHQLLSCICMHTATVAPRALFAQPLTYTELLSSLMAPRGFPGLPSEAAIRGLCCCPSQFSASKNKCADFQLALSPCLCLQVLEGKIAPVGPRLCFNTISILSLCAWQIQQRPLRHSLLTLARGSMRRDKNWHHDV